MERQPEVKIKNNLSASMELTNLFNKNNRELEILARAQEAEFIDADNIATIAHFLQSAKNNLEKKAKSASHHLPELNRSIKKIREESNTSEESTARLYDKEYGEGGAYGYVSALLSKEGIKLVTGETEDVIREHTLIDIGAGSNEFLRFCHTELGVPSSQLHGSDISEESTRRIAEDGFTAHHGRTESLDLPKESFDLAYLSYFIDYDTNQPATFSASIDIVKPGGLLVIEGLFPVRPFALLEKDARNHVFITRGKSVSEDVSLVTDALKALGKEKGREVSLERIVKTHRYVSSRYGFHKLPSYFLTFRVN